MNDERLSPEDLRAIEHARQMARDPVVRRAQDFLASAGESIVQIQNRATSALRARWASIATALGTIDWNRVFQAIDEYQRLIPDNLSHRALAALMREQPDDGIPIAWVPRAEIVEALLFGCSTHEDRVRLLAARFEDILDDCDEILVDSEIPTAREATNAVAALRAGHVGPAQSHASNLVDSVVLHVFAHEARSRPGAARSEAVRRAGAAMPDDEVTWRALVDQIVLAPLIPGFGRWMPGDQEPPHNFNRHVTSHAAHLDGVFTDLNALIAVMLATSLVRNYAAELG